MNISGITSDSRKVKNGYAYVAIRGSKFNGEDFIQDAINSGAIEIVVSEDSTVNSVKNAKLTKVPNARKYIASIASKLYPNQPQNIVAITGTNGKTSVAFFFKQIAEFCGHKAASIGTLGVLADNYPNDAEDVLTSPETVELHSILHNLANSGVKYTAIEASSHGLSQNRVDSVNFRVGGFTNLTRDHMDYHGSVEDYFNAKARLFKELVKETAVLNADIPEYSKLKEIAYEAGLKVMSYGKKGESIKLITSSDEVIVCDIMGKKYNILHKLSGSFQVYNIMCAIGLSLGVGLEIDNIIKSIEHIKAAPGRLELAGTYNGAEVYVDYAHTPDALENALSSLKSHCSGKLHVLFGCGGDRDPGKRPQMGEIANRLADEVIVTDDNPRTEDSASIRKQILAACPKAFEFGDRAIAIKEAMKRLNNNDMLLLAGKGHETYQVIGKEKIHFCDKEQVQNFIKANNG